MSAAELQAWVVSSTQTIQAQLAQVIQRVDGMTPGAPEEGSRGPTVSNHDGLDAHTARVKGARLLGVAMGPQDLLPACLRTSP